MSHEELVLFYIEAGLNKKDYCIGLEHPDMENRAIKFLKTKSNPKILEIGYQSGGFSIPIIEYFCNVPGFQYTGIDNMAFNQSVDSVLNVELLKSYLDSKGISGNCYTFQEGDANKFLKECLHQYDLILIDHLKALYSRELITILSGQLIEHEGVVFLHDVLKRAKGAWVKCKKICNRYGCTYEIDKNIASGLAIVRPGPKEKAIGIQGFMNHTLSVLNI